MASGQEVAQTIRETRAQAEKAVQSMPDAGWTAGVYESGWNARELLCHMASSSGVARFLLSMAQSPRASGGAGAPFDIDAFNAQEVARRQAKSVGELLAELSEGMKKDAAAVETAPEEVLQKHFRAPWGAEGRLADVIGDSVKGHLGGHLDDLRKAAGA
jgi:hypothetical protein